MIHTRGSKKHTEIEKHTEEINKKEIQKEVILLEAHRIKLTSLDPELDILSVNNSQSDDELIFTKLNVIMKKNNGYLFKPTYKNNNSTKNEIIRKKIVAKKYKVKQIFYHKVMNYYKCSSIPNLKPMNYIIFFDDVIPLDRRPFMNHSNLEGFKWVKNFSDIKRVKSVDLDLKTLSLTINYDEDKLETNNQMFNQM